MRLALFPSLAFYFATPVIIPAQNLIFASLSGTLTDSAGAVIPGASVSLINEGTEDRRIVKTDANGVYQLPNLQPATYRLEAEAPGFKRFVRTQITLGVNQVAQIDVRHGSRDRYRKRRGHRRVPSAGTTNILARAGGRRA